MNKITKVLGTKDPFTVLGDLELDLVLSFFSVTETITIRRVSTLWKARTDFRLSSAAIRRHYPESEEARIVYHTRDEEALAFRRTAFRHETRAKPSMALIFPKTKEEVPWCLCNHHMVWTDGGREILYIKRVWDPENPSRKTFRSKSLETKSFPIKGKTRSGQQVRVQWMIGSNKNKILLVHIGADSLYLNPKRVNHPRWTLAISVTSGEVIWSQKAHIASGSRNWNPASTKFRDTPASLGHGNACILDTGGNLTILDLASGQQKVCKHLQNHSPFLNPPVNRAFNRAYNLTAHPTMELCFVTLGRLGTGRATFSIFSTKTAEEVKSLPLDTQLHTQDWASTRLHFGKKPIAEGGGERVWVLFNCSKNHLWQTGSNAIVAYEIDLGTFTLVEVSIWRFSFGNSRRLWLINTNPQESPSDPRVILGLLDPTTRKGYMCISLSLSVDQFQMREITFKRVSQDSLSEVKRSTYIIEDCTNFTIPARISIKDQSKKAGSEQRDSNESEDQPHRRELIFKSPPTKLGSHLSEHYIAFSTPKGIYLFGFMPRW